MTKQKYVSYSTNELRKHFCPYCGRELEVQHEKKIINSTDSDADYWYSQAEVDGYSARKSRPLNIDYADYYCTHCNVHYTEKNVSELTMKLKDRRSILPIKLEKIRNCPVCGGKLKRKLRKFCVPISVNSTVENKHRDKRTYSIVIPYYICCSCKNEIYPKSNCGDK